MSFSINAWIDRISPFISIENIDTGQEIARFEGTELAVHIEQGNIFMGDFCNPDARQKQLLIMDLLLLHCCNAVDKEFPRECVCLQKKPFSSKTPQIL